MATIPLPALDVRPSAAQPDILENYGRLMQLQNMQRQTQMQQQEAPLRLQALQQTAQSGQIDLQQKQQQLTDQQATTKAMQDWDGKDYQQLYPLISKHGGSAQAVLGLKAQVLKQQTDIATQAKDNAQALEANTTAQAKQSDAITGALAPLLDSKQVPDDQLPSVLQSTVQSLVDRKLLDPQHAQAANQLGQSGDPEKIRAGVTQFRNTLMAQSQITEEALKHAQIGQANAAVVRGQAETEQAATNEKEAERYHNVEAGQRQQSINVENARLQFDKQRQGTQDDQSVEALAQQVAKYDQPMPNMSRNSPFNRAVTSRALEINPNLSKEGYDTKQDFFSSKGHTNAQIQSFNKVAEHLSDVRDASDKAGFTPLGITGSAKALSTAEQVFGTEDIKYLSGKGVGTEGELNKLHDNLHSSVQSIRSAALDQLEKMTASAGRQFASQYERGTKMPFDPSEHFNPAAQAILKKSGGGAITVTDPDGSSHPFDNQQQADAFKKLAGIK